MPAFFMHIGLTGNIATGKSTVFRLLTEREGVVGFDADLVVHDLYQRKSVVDQLVSHLGSGILDEQGAVSRVNVRNLFLEDKKVRGLLESIFHPLVYEEYLMLSSNLSSGSIL